MHESVFIISHFHKHKINKKIHQKIHGRVKVCVKYTVSVVFSEKNFDAKRQVQIYETGQWIFCLKGKQNFSEKCVLSASLA